MKNYVDEVMAKLDFGDIDEMLAERNARYVIQDVIKHCAKVANGNHEEGCDCPRSACYSAREIRGLLTGEEPCPA